MKTKTKFYRRDAEYAEHLGKDATLGGSVLQF